MRRERDPLTIDQQRAQSTPTTATTSTTAATGTAVQGTGNEPHPAECPPAVAATFAAETAPRRSATTATTSSTTAATTADAVAEYDDGHVTCQSLSLQRTDSPAVVGGTHSHHDHPPNRYFLLFLLSGNSVPGSARLSSVSYPLSPHFSRTGLLTVPNPPKKN